MTITSENQNFDAYSYKIDLGGSGNLVVDRNFALKNGETVAIRVKLNTKENADLRAINVNSIHRAIEILQSFLPKEQ
ncbi:hypothetical protein [Burkholderia ubonensis]|uniref:hypothetical protein n=1 Tax=Burkholderia ubonensis TaxID=101571 RepID=UPI00075589F7|nr:hypothetical protein [Burkholderia ubonensis]KVQ12447.1 hypothetical protein WJ98_28875 [Burkholderia ubonensis]KVQ12592.1 hypothetical protein WJ98_29610 [Burkholderia ubonensis]